MKLYIVKESWHLDNTQETGQIHIALSLEKAIEKFFEVREHFLAEFKEWYGEKDGEDWDGNWDSIKNWNITEDANLVFTCTNADYESESVELYSQETID